VAIVTGTEVATALGMPATNGTLDSVAATATALLTEYLIASAVTTPPLPVKEAGIVLAVDIWQNRTAAGGQSVGMDGTPGPYRMGSSLLARVNGLIGPWLDQTGDAA
jgi:hypothetical protein